MWSLISLLVGGVFLPLPSPLMLLCRPICYSYFKYPVLAAAPDIFLANPLPPFFYYFLILSYKYFLVPPRILHPYYFLLHLYFLMCIFLRFLHFLCLLTYSIELPFFTYGLLSPLSNGPYIFTYFYHYVILFFIITWTCYILYYSWSSLFLKIPVLAAAPDMTSLFFLRVPRVP